MPASTTTATVNVVEEDDEKKRRAVIDNFAKSYNILSAQATRAEEENNYNAVDLHVQLSVLLANMLRKHASFFTPNDVRVLRAEVVNRCNQAILLRSFETAGFGDLLVSMNTTRNLNDDLDRARRRIEASSSNGEAGGVASENADDDESDPRERTDGLYEYVAYEKLDTALNDLPGYEAQHRALMHAYYIIEDDDESSADVATASTKSGANAILHGPPGTGKTAAARAVAASLKLDFVFVNAENLVSAYRSETEKNLRKIYRRMRLLTRLTGRNVVLLLDEVDGLVKNRKGDITSGDYSLLTRFLTILEPNDGTDNYGVFSLFTTNRLDNLDDAFKRRCVSVFFGAVTSENARISLFRKFFGDSIALPLERESDVANLVEEWVPGDYARFKRDIAQPMQLREYLNEMGVGMDEFYSRVTDATDDRRVRVHLTPLEYESIRPKIADYTPVTPFEAYARDYGVAPTAGV